MSIEPQTEQHLPFTCTLDCGSRCVLHAVVRNGVLLRIDTPDDADTPELPRLVPCARGRAHRGMLNASSRLLNPLRRTGPRGSGEFEPISWDEAVEEVSAALDSARAEHGPQAILAAGGHGSGGGRGISGAAATHRFFTHYAPVSYLTGNMSSHSIDLAARLMLGDTLPCSDRADLLNSRLIILWGMNPAELHMSHNTARFVADARERGARVVLIDPRWTDSGVLADEWIPIRPGTDTAMVLAMCYVLECESLADRDFIARCMAGYAEFADYLLGRNDGQPKTPAWAEGVCGVPAERIASLAREYAQQSPAALLPGWGPQRTLVGEQWSRAVLALSCISGNVGIPGGALATTSPGGRPLQFAALPRGPYGMGRTLSAPAWAQDILQKRLNPPVTTALITASNLVNRSPNTRANIEALMGLDFVAVIDPFFTPTARLADIVLPAATEMEHPDIVSPWGYDLQAFWSQQVVEAAGEARSDYAIFAGLAERFGLREAYTAGRTEAEWVEYMLSQSQHEQPLREMGVYRGDPYPRVALREFRQDPAAHPLHTHSGRIELASSGAPRYNLPELPEYSEPVPTGTEDLPLHLLTPHHKLRANSSMAGNPWLQELEVQRVWINPQDATARGIADGDRVEVFNRNGRVRLPAYVTGRIMPGVVCIYEGAWYAPEDGVDVGGCANVLTGSELSPSGGTATHSFHVEIERAGA